MKLQAPLAIATVLLANLTPIFSFGIYSRFAYLGLVIMAIVGHAREVVPFAVLMFMLSAYTALAPLPMVMVPTLPFLIPLLVSILLLSRTPYRSEATRWIKAGKGDLFSIVFTGATGIASTGALVLWAIWTDQLGIGERMVQGFAGIPFWILVGFGIPAFAVLNAVAEECVYRGVMQEALTRTLGSTPLILVLQAGAFAAVHFKMGFPNGLMGYAMVFVYGLALGYLRHRTGGMRWPIAAHVLADLTIGYVLIFKFLF